MMCWRRRYTVSALLRLSGGGTSSESSSIPKRVIGSACNCCGISRRRNCSRTRAEMLQSRTIPCLLLKGRGLYKTVKFKHPVYVGDPINAVRIFNEKGVDELVVLDIGASINGGGPNFDLLQDIASEAFVPLCYGGGIGSVADMARLLRLGMEKVSLNTAAFESQGLVETAVRQVGLQSFVVSNAVKKNLLGLSEVVTRSGTKSIKVAPVTAARAAERIG